jgi:hypothetical protein
MAKISGKAGRAMATVPTGQPTGLTRRQAQAELDVVRTYETTFLSGFARAMNMERPNLSVELRVRQQRGKYLPDVTVVNKVSRQPLSVMGPLRAATYAERISLPIADLMRQAIRTAEVAGR